MACFHPLLATYTQDPNKPVKVLGSAYLDKLTTNYIRREYLDKRTGELYRDYFLVPCGKCVGCRMDYSREWADRMTMESMLYDKDKMIFLSLTYDDEHLPIGESGKAVLKPKDLQDFMKRLRIRAERETGQQNLRFYGCGEYGSTTGRPHYHVIIYGLEVFDKKPFFINKMFQQIYISDWLADIWGNGLVSFGNVEWRSCAYVARYVMKKHKGKDAISYYDDKGITPEFVRMSNRPGIGLPYFERNYERIYENDNIILPPIDGKPNIVKPPRYFDDKYASLNEECRKHLEYWKMRRRENAEKLEDIRASLTDLDQMGYFEAQEKRLEKSVKKLVRLLD